MTEILSQINEEIKMLMIEKNLAFKLYCCSNKNMFFFEIFLALTLIRLGFLNVVFLEGGGMGAEGGRQFDLLSYIKKNLFNFNITS